MTNKIKMPNLYIINKEKHSMDSQALTTLWTTLRYESSKVYNIRTVIYSRALGPRELLGCAWNGRVTYDTK